MKPENLKLSRQIFISLGAIFVVAAIFVSVSLFSMENLWRSTSGIYNNPLAVRRAVGEMKVDVLLIHRDMRQLPFEKNQQEVEKLLNNIESYDADISRHLDVLYDRYLGPQSDLDEASTALAQWKAIRSETVRLLRAGLISEVENRVKAGGIGGTQADAVLGELTDISDYAINKADELFAQAHEHRNQIMAQMALLCIVLVFVLVGIGNYLRKGILPPLAKLNAATEAMQRGELHIRIENESQNELGELSRAFNAMAQTIQAETRHKEDVAVISSVMFKHTTLRPFCRELLEKLLALTDSQMGAVYFLNEANGLFERYESIGVQHNSLRSFSAAAKEGEFGAALATKKVVHVTDIPLDVQVVFSAVSGDYKAKEIITIPVVSGSDVVSVISLASIKCYAADSVRLVNGTVNEITASLNAILASRRALEFSQKLQSTNAELEQQAQELGRQADELTQQNAELEMQKNQLDEASRLKTNFLSNMSHELRTPLNSVIALSGVLSRRLADKIPEEERSYLEIIERNGKNLLTLINDILDISRIEAGREEIEITAFDANHAIAEVIELLAPQAQQQNIALIHLSKDEKIPIGSDADKFRHVLQNLIGNAIKFTEKGSVEIKAALNENSIEVAVTDTGIGIPAEHLSHIFDEFRQADSSTSRRYGGSGLGLAISKKYAHLLGGTIAVTSTPNAGSTFILTLPLQYSGENCAAELPYPHSRQTVAGRFAHRDDSTLSEKTILLVEDNESSIIQIKDVMEEIGCRVQVARDAKEAFACIENARPDAIILDLMMPDVDGFKVLEVLRNAKETAHVPVLILTAKHITKEELKFLKRNNIHQLIQKGDIKRLHLQQAIAHVLCPGSAKAEQPPKKPQTIHGKPVVLVVEDNRDNMTTVRALLQEHHTLLEAVNAQEGIEMAKTLVPNLILMDIALPDVNGIEAFRKIRRMPQTRHIPVVALTASAMVHDRETVLSHGFDAFIAKPIIANEFFAVIDEVLYGK